MTETSSKVLTLIALLLSAFLWWGWLWALEESNSFAPVELIVVVIFIGFLLLFTGVLIVSAWKCPSIKGLAFTWGVILILYGYFPIHTWIKKTERDNFDYAVYEQRELELTKLLLDSTSSWQQIKPYGKKGGMDPLYRQALLYRRADIARPISDRWWKPERFIPSNLFDAIGNHFLYDKYYAPPASEKILETLYSCNPGSESTGGWSPQGIDQVVALMIDNGDIDIDCQLNISPAKELCGGSLLCLALSRADTATATLLLDRGINAAARNRLGENALHFAAHDAQNRIIIERILSLGISPNNTDNEPFAHSPIWIAIQHGNLDIVQLFVKHHALLPLFISLETDTINNANKDEMRQYLISKGVEIGDNE